MSILNEDIHAHLLELGYTHTHYDAYWEDVGDAESGPKVLGHPEYDEYESADDRIFIDHNRHFAHWEARDLAFEAWVDEMAEPPAI